MRPPVHRPADAAAEDPAGLGNRRGRPDPAPAGSRRLLVVSHPAVVSVNQEVYGELTRRGWALDLVVPSRWRHSYSAAPVAPSALPGLEGALRPTPVALAGRAQRHFYLTRPGALLARTRPDVAFIEGEPFSIAAAQWGYALQRRGIPFGVQSYENIDRAFPPPVGLLRSQVLARAAFVAARSDTAGELARRWGARGEVAFAPPAVPDWPSGQRPAAAERPFTVGFAGRLVPSKGLADLLGAVRALSAPVELLLIGDGELRAELEGQEVPGSTVRVLTGLTHDQMPDGYAQIDVLVLPSRTTATWKEQFGRVIVEALWCGVPVVGSDSGEIPWLIGLTGGGLVFAEGDRGALADRLQRLRADPELRGRLAADGRAAVERLFTVPAATDPLERLLENAVASRSRSG